ncbi:MAG TPA: hypothetical protein PLC80_11155 [Draconibacterium sp.]|nr:hypothetical protein [Draconibacterium sp.]
MQTQCTYKKLIILFILFSVSITISAQYAQLQLADTVKSVYPYNLPILGAKAFERGFDIPLPVGGMLNFFTATQDILIPEVAVGFSSGSLPEIPLTDITNIIEFGEISAQATSINIRPDAWILPFLNVYGIFGKTYATTTVELASPVKFKTVAELEGISYGFGTTGAGGLGKYFFVLDGNWVWTEMSNFNEPVKTGTFSFRLGRAFKIRNKPNSNVAFWAGGMRINMGGITEGNIALNEILPPGVDSKRDEIVAGYWNWYDNEATIAQKIAADKVLTPIVEKLEEVDGSGNISYQIKKEPKQKWNMIIGGQYQLNKHHQFRAEGGIIGNRKSLLLSYNYRFGFSKKI